MLTKMLKTFHQVEPQLLRGKIAGLMISQRPVGYDAENGYGVPTVDAYNGKFIENGIICSLNLDGKIVSYTSGAMFLHYTEELNTIVDAKKYFAVEGKGAETYLRLVQLFPGDEFVTDNVVVPDGGENYGYAVIDNGRIKLQSANTNAKFRREKGDAFDDTLPDGTKGYHFVVVA